MNRAFKGIVQFFVQLLGYYIIQPFHSHLTFNVLYVFIKYICNAPSITSTAALLNFPRAKLSASEALMSTQNNINVIMLQRC